MQSTTQNDACCAMEKLERPRYFPRQLVGPTELNLAQDYFRQRMRLHNRMLHGWGVVCGAKVSRVKSTRQTVKPKGKKPQGDPNEKESRDVLWEPCMVTVSPGYILGPCGDEIQIESKQKIDVCKLRITGDASGDPYCSDPVFKREEFAPQFLAVKYKQIQTRPVRAQPAGCGCEETSCEHSRWQDCYEFGILNACPPDHLDPPHLPYVSSGQCPKCPDCPDHPWVVLAKFSVDSAGTILTESATNEWAPGEPDNCCCRRLVASFGNVWWKCEEGAHKKSRWTNGLADTDAGVSPETTGETNEATAVETATSTTTAPAEMETLVAGQVGEEQLLSVPLEDAVTLPENRFAVLKTIGMKSAYDLWVLCLARQQRTDMAAALSGIGTEGLKKCVCQIDLIRACKTVAEITKFNALTDQLYKTGYQTVSQLSAMKNTDVNRIAKDATAKEVLGAANDEEAVEKMNRIIEAAGQLEERVEI